MFFSCEGTEAEPVFASSRTFLVSVRFTTSLASEIPVESGASRGFGYGMSESRLFQSNCNQ